MPAVFDERTDRLAGERAQLRDLLDDRQWRAAERATLNAHYTDAALAQVMWDVVAASLPSQPPPRVLEPGCGAGTFIGLAPAVATGPGSRLIGVELDPTTAAIAKHLYPHADIRAESFADTRIPTASVDVVIGNVPFGKVALHDKAHNAGNHSLHNHFIIKSLALTRPGGVVAVLTSHWTMDAANPSARREIAAMADLVAAVRLPMSAHQKAAGTQVITDVLVLRRRAEGDAPADASGWQTTTPTGDDPDAPVLVNSYFAARPDRVIGELGTRMGQFGPELAVTAQAGTDIAEQLGTQLRHQIAVAAAAADPGQQPWQLIGPAVTTSPELRVLAPDAPAHHLDHHIEAGPAGTFTVVEHGTLAPYPVPARQAKELTALLGLRDTTVALLSAEASSVDDTTAMQALRSTLNTQYDAYAKQWGPINRITFRRTGRVDEVTGDDKLARISPPQGGFRIDPHAPAVYALEDFDAAAGTARKAPIMTGRVVAPRVPRLGADSPADAVAICLDTHGEVRLDEVARLLGRTEADTASAIAGLVFTDPDSPDRLVPAAEYLSGNVRIKLAAAEAAAERDSAMPHGAHQWDANVTALRGVIPTDLTPAEIDARLGASWIDATVIRQFLRETLEDPTVAVENPGGATWAVTGARHSVLSTSTFGTQRVSAIDLAAALLEQRQIRVTDETPDGRRIPNLTETIAAQEKGREIAERFSEWIWEDPDRTTALARRYNDMFNSIALRSYDGAQMQLPGLAVTFTPRDHQTAAVARIVSEPSVLLAHEVGAGKTAEMVIGAMELRRLGMAAKPAVVVPNHMLEQFSREWMQLYPQARILAASVDDLSRDKRRLMVARIATGDWDAVILSRSAFERVPLSIRAQERYLDAQLDDMRHQLENAKGGGGLTVKRLQGSLARAEERLKQLTDGAKDPGITFEETGIDYLMVDEAHGYKNLRTVSNIPGVAIEGSQRASDLDMKMAYLRDRHGGRVATFATATPIANSVSEAYTMQRFLRPDLLQTAGLTDFDTWAATFGEVTTDLELAPDGTRFRMQARFAKFRNVPELLRMWHVSADIKTAEDLQLPTPDLRNGRAETVVVPATPELSDFMRELSARADAVQARRVDPDVDNMLRVATHGRMAALDLRLLGRSPGPDAKLASAADRIAAIHHSSADRSYPNSPTPGALQIVFCDLGTPQQRGRGGGTLANGWNAYDELKARLIERGVPADKIRFVHEARNDKEKGELFAAARNGRVSVLVGSTEKMGVGTNVQARAIALHHLDCPWRPADIAQREGRILRQGNLNPEVEIVRYVSEGSFDAYLWQTVERKAKFIGQVMRGRLDVREIEDIGDTALSYSEVKALATGDPRILEKARADADMTKLERLERAHGRNQRALSATIDRAEEQLPKLHADRQLVESALQRRTDTSGDHFAMTVGGVAWATRADAAAALRHALTTLLPTSDAGYDRPTTVASIAGHEVIATARRYLEPHISLELAGVPRSHVRVEPDELRTDRPLGIVIKLENRAADLERTLSRLIHEADALAREGDRARNDYGQPFAHREALADARIRSTALAAELAEQSQTQNAEDAQPAPGATAAPRQPAPNETAPAAPQSRDWAARPPRTPLDHVDMARDSALATFTAGAPVASMDRPSVERELRHVHGDGTYYSTAHAARDALSAARSTRTAPTDTPAPATSPSAAYPSAERYPAGTPVTIHAIGGDEPRPPIGTGTVVDHPSPAHATVESPLGDRRIAPITHLSAGSAPADGLGGRTEPAQRWAGACDRIDPRVTTDPHWPALVAQLERASARGADVEGILASVAATEQLPGAHPARDLGYLVADAAPDIYSPARLRTLSEPPAPRRLDQPAPQAAAGPDRPAPPR